MKNHIIQVASAVPALKVGDVTYNTDRIIEIILGMKNRIVKV